MSRNQGCLRTGVLAAAVSTLALLAACDDESRRAGQPVDQGIAQAERAADPAAATMKQDTDTQKQGAERAAAAVDDAAITAAITARIANDDRLSRLKIGVETKAGHVALSGEAPDEAARQRAAELAAAVDGVVAVNNRLVVVANG